MPSPFCSHPSCKPPRKDWLTASHSDGPHSAVYLHMVLSLYVHMTFMCGCSFSPSPWFEPSALFAHKTSELLVAWGPFLISEQQTSVNVESIFHLLFPKLILCFCFLLPSLQSPTFPSRDQLSSISSLFITNSVNQCSLQSKVCGSIYIWCLLNILLNLGQKIVILHKIPKPWVLSLNDLFCPDSPKGKAANPNIGEANEAMNIAIFA